MAHLLGSKFCIESLRSDVTDLQSAVSDVFSRTGPIRAPSWKYPDKASSDLDIPDLLEMYDFTDDEEERQVSHIVLLELVIDRLVLLLQAMAKYLEQTLNTGRATTAAPPGSNSIGLVVKKYWNKAVQLHSMVQQLQSENKSKARKISDLENTVKTLQENINEQTASLSSINPTLVDTMSRRESNASSFLDIAKDGCNKSCQTLETAFVPCESCERVQINLREVGDNVINVCQTQGLPSSLHKYRNQIQGLGWFSANDVARWCAEQNKDIQRINKHLESLYATIDPLKSDLNDIEKKNKKLENKMADFDKAIQREKETQSATMRLHDVKMKEMEKKSSESLAAVQKTNDQLEKSKTELENQVTSIKSELNKQENLLKELEATKSQLESDLKNNTANCAQIKALECETENLQSQLKDVNEKLKQSTKELSKEQAKTKSVNKLYEALQGKQSSLLERIDALDQENEEIKEEFAALEEMKEELEEKLEKAQDEKKRLEKHVKEEQRLVNQLTKEKEKLEQSIQELETSLGPLEEQVTEAKEREKLLVEYPDLNGPVNPDYEGTGDIGVDMDNQVKANSIRIQILEEQNQGLRRTIQKLLQQQSQGSSIGGATEITGPVPLWKSNSVDGHVEPTPANNRQSRQPSNNANNSNNEIGSLQKSSSHPDLSPRHESRPKSGSYRARRYSQSPVSSDDSANYALPPRPPSQKERKNRLIPNKANEKNFLAPGKTSEVFTVEKAERPASRKSGKKNHSRPSSASKPVDFSQMNSSSISAFLKLKHSGLLQAVEKQSRSRPTSGKEVMYGADNTIKYVCGKCDKVYNNSQDLDIHKSYCAG